MKITVEIDENEILEGAKAVVVKSVADGILSEYRGHERYTYRQVIKECVREAIKGDIDNLSERAVAAASTSIENRAIKKLMNQMLEDKK